MFVYPILRYSAEPKVTFSDLKAGFLIEDVDCSTIGQWMVKHQVAGIMEGEVGYSHHWFKVPSKPYIIYYQGNIDLLHRPKLGIVGSRKATSYGIQVTKDLFSQLQGNDVVTISGGAEGIDELCHNLSIEHNIPTICVLGGGLAYYLNHARRGLFERIVAHGGLVLSEFRLKEQPTPYTFPQRNRIIAGLSDRLFVPCAAEESGSLITVADARKVNIPVFGVPGSLYDDGHRGVNKAITNGDMQAVYDMKIFVASLGLATKDNEKKQNKSIILMGDQLLVYEYLQGGNLGGIEHIAWALGKCPLDVSMMMTELEMEGLVYEERPGIWKSK